jgi:hypothetical protein
MAYPRGSRALYTAKKTAGFATQKGLDPAVDIPMEVEFLIGKGVAPAQVRSAAE